VASMLLLHCCSMLFGVWLSLLVCVMTYIKLTEVSPGTLLCSLWDCHMF
jgi:hypothetical protein